MKRNLVLMFLGVAVMCGLSMSARATDYAPGPSNATIVFTNNVDGLGIGGIYTGTLNGVATNFMCADDTHNIGYNLSWPVHSYSLTSLVSSGAYNYIGSSSGGGTGFDPTYQNATEAYTMEAYLEVVAIGGYELGTLNSQQITAINYAIWSITNPGGPVTDPNSIYLNFTPAYYIGQALEAYNNHWGTTNGQYVTFYVPTGNGTNGQPPQLFSSINTPEPISMALMGTFLSLAGLGLGKKKLFS